VTGSRQLTDIGTDCGSAGSSESAGSTGSDVEFDGRKSGNSGVDPVRETRVVGRPPAVGGPAGVLGTHRAPDGSDGARLWLDLDHPHAALVVGKRGYGKSYTLGVLAEELARVDGVAPVVVDPVGVFATLEDPVETDSVPARVIDTPKVSARAVDPPAWCEMLGLSAECGPGALVWRVAERADSLSGMIDLVEDARVDAATRQAAANHLRLAVSWDVFDPEGCGSGLTGTEATVLDASGLDAAPTNALVRAVADRLYAGRVEGRIDRLPWLLVDEAHVAFDGVAAGSLCRLLRRGRQPGVSLVVATQRPSILPDIAASQADLTIAHRLTARPDRQALERARPSYVEGSLVDRAPARPGEAILVDDATETVHTVRIRERDTPHGGRSPRASTRSRSE